ncbi:AraC family transcriptional regulator [Bradyrhizobium oligotrophicum]|uniref:AraC family transcriptional regulator n=1 Tax=Bradyrhizobium oligotrophicum TaxID=44255 RepID=UPI003EBF46EB
MPTKLASVYDALVHQGHAPADALKGTDLNVQDVHSPDTRISLSQLMTAYRNAIRLSTDPHLAYRIGQTVHVSAYGMYGYAILCSPDFRTACDFALRYHVLATPLAMVRLEEDGELATWTIEPNAHTLDDQPLYRFVLEKQIGVHISLMRDLMGPAFVPQEIHLKYATGFGISSSEVGCEVRYSRQANEIVFQTKWLDERATFGNRTTYSHVVDVCNKLLADLALRAGAAGQIREILLRDIADPPAFSSIARRLGSNERSLRRALERQGLSFRGLRDELRSRLALEYLRGTALTNDDIAVALGFSDGAAFRRAFQRWTKKTPNQIRNEPSETTDGRSRIR